MFKKWILLISLGFLLGWWFGKRFSSLPEPRQSKDLSVSFLDQLEDQADRGLASLPQGSQTRGLTSAIQNTQKVDPFIDREKSKDLLSKFSTYELYRAYEESKDRVDLSFSEYAPSVNEHEYERIVAQLNQMRRFGSFWHSGVKIETSEKKYVLLDIFLSYPEGFKSPLGFEGEMRGFKNYLNFAIFLSNEEGAQDYEIFVRGQYDFRLKDEVFHVSVGSMHIDLLKDVEGLFIPMPDMGSHQIKFLDNKEGAWKTGENLSWEAIEENEYFEIINSKIVAYEAWIERYAPEGTRRRLRSVIPIPVHDESENN